MTKVGGARLRWLMLKSWAKDNRWALLDFSIFLLALYLGACYGLKRFLIGPPIANKIAIGIFVFWMLCGFVGKLLPDK